MDEDRKTHWDGVYGTKAETDVSWFEPAADLSLDLIARTGAEPDAAIIDVGGGLSPLADGLAARGHTDITVLDISAEAIGKRLKRQPAGSPIQGIVADITQWRPARAYDVWHDRAVLHFLTSDEDRAAYHRALSEGLATGGQAIIATFAPTGPERCSGLPVRRYGPSDLTAFLGPRFQLIEAFEFDHETPGGSVQRFHVGRLKKTA